MKNSLGKVLIAAPVHRILTEGLSGLGYECVMQEQINQQVAFGLVHDCVGIVTSTRLQLNRELIDASPLLTWIGRMGSGMEVVDVPYAREKGIACYSSPEGNCNAVGEHALGMLLALIRRINWSQNEMTNGIWKRDENRGIELEGKTVGIIGYGHTGAAFARKLAGFDVRILAYDKYNPDCMPPHIEGCASMDKLMQESDIISFHVPLQADTIYYCSKDFIGQVGKPFILINTSRGPVVDMLAVYEAMKQGKITGVCLDVFEHEPLSAMTAAERTALNEMLQRPDFIATPHIAGYTHEALYKMSKTLLDKISSHAM